MPLNDNNSNNVGSFGSGSLGGGTPSEYIQVVRGAKGEKGDTGATGPQGEPGLDGADGVAALTTHAELRAYDVSSVNDGDYITTSGYYAAGDGGGGTYVANTNSTSYDFGGGHVKPDSGPSNFRWVLQPTRGAVNAKQFGARGIQNANTITYSSVNSRYPVGIKGTWWELLSDLDTVDAVGIQACIDWSLDNRCNAIIPNGIYQVNRAIWYGSWTTDIGSGYDTEHYPPQGSGYGNYITSGHTIGGESEQISRIQADGYGSTSIVLNETVDISNTWTLRFCHGTATGGTFKMRMWWSGWVGAEDVSGGTGYTDTGNIAYNATCATVQTALETIFGVGRVVVTCKYNNVDYTGSATLNQGHSFQIRVVKDVDTPCSFLGDLTCPRTAGFNSLTGTTGVGGSNVWPILYVNSGILIKKGRADSNHGVHNLTLAARPYKVDEDNQYNGGGNHIWTGGYYASFGLVWANSSGTNMDCANVYAVHTRWGFGITENGMANGENWTFRKCWSSYCFGHYYCNAGQAFGTKFDQLNAYTGGFTELADYDNDAAQDTQYMIWLGGGEGPGFDLMALQMHCTMQNDDLITNRPAKRRNVIVKIQRGAGFFGQVNVIGGRVEHANTIVEIPQDGNRAHNGRILFEAVNITGMRPGSKFPFVKEISGGGNGDSQEVIIRNCRMDTLFPPMDEAHNGADGALYFHADSVYSNNRWKFQNCSFDAFTGRVVKLNCYSFENCTWRDTIGYEQGRMRVFSEMSDDLFATNNPVNVYTSGLGNNLLRLSDFDGLGNGTSVSPPSPWSISGAASTFAKFYKWDAAESGSQHSPSNEAFMFSLQNGATLKQSLTTDLNSASDSTPILLNYEAVVQLKDGNTYWDFSIVDDTDGTIFAQKRVMCSVSGWDNRTQVVRLTAAITAAQGSGHKPQIKITNSSDGNRDIRFYRQSAWSDVSNASHIRNTSNSSNVSGTAFWSLSAQDVKFPGRIQLPARPATQGFKSTITIPDLAAGEIYFDTTAKCWMGYDGTNWSVFSEDYRWSADKGDAAYNWASGDERFILFATSLTADRILQLGTANVGRGKQVTVVRTGGDTGGPWSILVRKQGNLTTIKSVVTATRATFEYDGSNWNWIA